MAVARPQSDRHYWTGRMVISTPLFHTPGRKVIAGQNWRTVAI
jgi:hypothetical protein